MKIPRSIESKILNILGRQKSILLLGPRQTGKTTLINKLKSDIYLNLARPDNRMRYEANPITLEQEIEALDVSYTPLILLDEIQKVPQLFDLVQDLIDKKVAQFVLTGSSARKLRRNSEVNLLPGRVIELRLDPLMLEETSTKSSLEDLLVDGSLPEIVTTKDLNARNELLASYVSTYLEEEIRQEAVVRKLGTFVRFLELAASEAGQEANVANIAQAIGVAQTTAQGYYDILVDCLIAERVDPFVPSSTRRRLAKSPKYLFFDLGVRRLAAREGRKPNREHFGKLFEQFIGIELIRLLRSHPERPRVYYWRDHDGPEIDWIIDIDRSLIPIEVKATNKPLTSDCKHLVTFLSEQKRAKKAYLICQIPRAKKLAANITAIPWQDVGEILKNPI